MEFLDFAFFSMKYTHVRIGVCPATRLLVIDTFAGKGRYSDEWPTDIEKYGSPVIAVMVALNFLYRKNHREVKLWDLMDFYSLEENNLENLLRSVARLRDTNPPKLPMLIQDDQISLIFIEKNKNNASHLETNLCAVLVYFFSGTGGNVPLMIIDYGDCIHIRITDERYPVSCYIFNTSFVNFTKKYWIDGRDLVDRSTLCMTFVDPFGYTDTPMKEVQAYTGPRRSVLINFMSSYINRFVNMNPEAVARCFGIEKVKELFCPDDADAVADFVAEIVRGCTPGNNVVNCTENYERMLRARAGSEFSVTFEMRGEVNAILYHLVFITNHQMQLKSMKEAMNKGTQYSDELKLSDYEIVRKGHALNLGNIQDKGRVADAIFQKFRGCKGVDISDIEKFILMDTPYLFQKNQLVIMMKELNPRITGVWDRLGNPPKRRYTFPDTGQPWYISFRDYSVD